MTVLSSNQDQIENFYNIAKQTPYIPDLGPGFFDNAIQPIGQGFERGELEIANFFSPENSNQAAIIRDAMASAVPDPRITGWLGNTLYGVSSAIPALTVGSIPSGPLGGAALLGATKGFARMQELEAKNVSPNVATSLGLLEGGTQALGALIPGGVGNTLLSKVLSGAAINTTIGGVNRALTGDILEANGYNDMAKQYKVVDGAQIASDLILGGIFGTMHMNAKTPEERIQNLDNNLPSDTDAALAANTIHQLEIDAAPGIPTDIAARNAHIGAMETATRQLLNGEEVNVADIMSGKDYLPKPANIDRLRAIDELAAEENYRLSNEPFDNYASTLIRRDAATAELDNLNSKLTDIEQQINNHQPVDVLAGRDTAIMSRIDEINTQLEQGSLSKTQQKPLLRERQTLQDEYNSLLDNSNVEEQRAASEAALNALMQQRTELMKQVTQKEATVEILSNEAINRGQRIAKKLQQNIPLLQEISQLAKEVKQEPAAEAKPATEKTTVPEQSKQEAPIADNTQPESNAEVTLAQTIATEKPDLVIPISETETLTASEALAKADNTIAEAQNFGKLFREAVNCFIRNGL